MPFLDAYTPEHRELLMGVARSQALAKGEYLIRRGDLRSDVYRLQSGVLEVVDPTRVPELIVNKMTPGAVVGELAFVTDTARTVDVRAGTDCVLLAWERHVLEEVFTEHPVIAAVFHEQVARLTSARLRRITDRAIAGTFAVTESIDADDDVRTWVERIVSEVKEVMPDLETQLRANADDPMARAAVVAALDQLEATVFELFEAHHDPGVATFAEKVLRSELHPYLARSSLAERALRRPHGRIGTVQIVAQARIGMPIGDGILGQLIDEWILDRPTFQALRALHPLLSRTVLRGLPDGRAARVQVLNVGTGALVSELAEYARPDVTFTVVDQSPLALALVDTSGLRPGIAIAPVQANLVALAAGELDLELPPQDIVVLHHLLEVLPERVVVSLLGVCRQQLAPDGALVVATLGPSRDRTFLDRVLGWPTIRRSRLGLDELLRGVGFTSVTAVGARGPAQLFVALEPR